MQGDIENLNFKNEIFDVTCCMESFVHLPNPQIAMTELARVTKPGGLIIANVTSNKILWRVRYRYFPRGFDGIWKAMSEKKFRTLFRNANLKIVKVIRQGPRYSPVFIIVISVKPKPESVQSQRHTH